MHVDGVPTIEEERQMEEDKRCQHMLDAHKLGMYLRNLRQRLQTERAPNPTAVATAREELRDQSFEKWDESAVHHMILVHNATVVRCRNIFKVAYRKILGSFSRVILLLYTLENKLINKAYTAVG